MSQTSNLGDHDSLDQWKDHLQTIPLERSNTSESLESLSSIDSSHSSISSTSSRPKNYFCDYSGCTKAFTRPSLLSEHQLTFHQGIKPFKCEQCDKQFSRKTHLERHLISHSDSKPFCCLHCGKGVTTRQQLKRHEVTHTKSFKCPYENCDEAYYKHPQLRSHILS